MDIVAWLLTVNMFMSQDIGLLFNLRRWINIVETMNGLNRDHRFRYYSIIAFIVCKSIFFFFIRLSNPDLVKEIFLIFQSFIIELFYLAAFWYVYFRFTKAQRETISRI